jgi:hypothetical protein
MKELMKLYSEMFNSMTTFQQVLITLWLLSISVFVVTYTYTWFLIIKSSFVKLKNRKPQTF